MLDVVMSRQRLDQFRVHGKPPHPLGTFSALMVGQTDFASRQVNVPLPGEAEQFTAASAGKVHCEQKYQILPLYFL
jgi:hypothetical protein